MISSPTISRFTRVLILSALLAGIFLCYGAGAASAGTTPASPDTVHYTGYSYKILDSARSDDECSPDSSHSYFYADDPYCGEKWSLVPALNARCGQPPAHCIDKTFNGGILIKERYYIKLTTNPDGTIDYGSRIGDGPELGYSNDGRVDSCIIWKDGKLISDSDNCGAAGDSSGSNTGGSSGSNTGSTSGDGGGLPLVPLAALAAILVAAGIAATKLLAGRGGGGGGATAPATPPPTTRDWTDDTGRQRTATLQPDGTWISDSGSAVDLEKADDARRQHGRDLERSRADQAGQIADDTAKADRDTRELDAINAATKKAAKAPDDLRKIVDREKTTDEGYSGLYKRQADKLDAAVKGGEAVVTAADFGVNVLEKVTGPVGTTIKTGYTIGKDLGKNMSSSYQKGESLLKGAAKGGLEAGFDLGFDKVKKTLPKVPGNWDFKPGDDSPLTPLGNGVAAATQSQAVKTLVKDPLKDIAKKASDKLLSGIIGKF